MSKCTKLWHYAAGDTIVEVMIVLAVLGGALVLSYSIANRSLMQSRDAQERTEIVNVLQGQLERLRASAADTNSALFHTTDSFCIDDTGQIVTVPSIGDLSTFPAACVQGYYHYYLTPDISGDTYTYTVYGVWDNVFGTGQDTASFIYKIHKPVAAS